MRYRHMLAAAALLAWGTGAAARDWAVYTSDNFAIYSDAREQSVAKAVADFEVFRTIALSLLGFRAAPDESRMRVVMYGGIGEFQKITGTRKVGGFFIEGAGNPRMVIGPERQDISSTEILFHEYVHFLTATHSRAAYPPWYREGLADLLATAQITPKVVRIGDVSEVRASWLQYERRMSVQDLIRPHGERFLSEQELGRFYASAWLMTHYLLMSAYGEHPQYRTQLVDYLVRLNRGEDPIAAFEPAFGMTPAQLDALIRRYQERGRVNFLDFPNAGYAGPIDRRVLTAAEAAAIRADIAIQTGNTALAVELLSMLDAAEAAGPDTAAALAMRAVLRQHQAVAADPPRADLAASADADRAAAMAAGAEDPATLANLAHYVVDQYDASAKAGAPDPALLEAAVDLAMRALQRDRRNASAYRFLALARERQGDRAAAIDTLVTAYQRLPRSVQLNLMLIEHLVQAERHDEALILAEEVYAAAHGAAERTRLQDLMEQIRARNVDLAWFRDAEEEG